VLDRNHFDENWEKAERLHRRLTAAFIPLMLLTFAGVFGIIIFVIWVLYKTVTSPAFERWLS
jgi:hypothetical protein